MKFKGKFDQYHTLPEKHAYVYEGIYSPKDSNLVMEGKETTNSRISRWANVEESKQRVKEQFSEHPNLFKILQYYGYENNNNWFSALL